MQTIDGLESDRALGLVSARAATFITIVRHSMGLARSRYGIGKNHKKVTRICR